MSKKGGLFKRRVLVDLVEAAYTSASSDDAWLHRLHDIANPVLDAGQGSIGFFVEAPERRIHGIIGDARLAQIVTPMHDDNHDAYRAYYEPRATWLHRLYGAEIRTKTARFLGAGGGDIWGLTCVDARGTGLVLTAPQCARRDVPLGTRAWTMAAVHLATAWRLRTQRRAPIDAVLTKAGKLLHREPTAAGSEKALAAAVVRRAEAQRSAEAAGSEAALQAWRGLANGRWSIVEQVESDGKQFLVARRNELETGDLGGLTPGALTPIERQACAMTAAGHSQKLIAYELGIHVSAVARHIANGMTKLGIRSSSVLARRFAWLPSAAFARK